MVIAKRDFSTDFLLYLDDVNFITKFAKTYSVLTFFRNCCVLKLIINLFRAYCTFPRINFTCLPIFAIFRRVANFINNLMSVTRKIKS